MKAPLVALALALAVTWARAEDNPLAREPILSAPDCAGPQNLIAEDAREPFNATFVRVQHIGDLGTEEVRGSVAHEVSWDVGSMTGLHTTTWAQRGYRDAPPPVAASAFQLACGDAGFFMNSFEFSHSLPLFGEGPSASIARVLDPAPPAFDDARAPFAIEASMAVPTSYSPNLAAGAGVTALSLFYYVKDMTTGTAIAHVIFVHDNRPAGFGGSGEEFLAHDGITAFAASPLAEVDGKGNRVRFVEVGPASERIRYGRTWAEPAFYRAEIPYARFKAMLEALKASALPGTQLSTEPLDYRIVFVGVLAEIFVGTTRGHDVMFGGSVRGLMLSRARAERRVGRFR